MYNAQVFCYPHGVQIRLYSNIVDNSEVDIDSRFDIDWDEFEFNPFTDAYEKLTPIERAERTLRSSVNRSVNQVYYLARSNTWEWFITLTFSPDKVNRYDYDACVKLLSKWLNNAKRKCPNMRYLVVPEKHKDGAFHFHGLFAYCDALGFVDSGKRYGRQIIYNVGSYQFGWTTATKVVSSERSSKYICKYINKTLAESIKGKKRYWASRNLDKADVVPYVMDSISKSDLLDSISDYITHVKKVNGLNQETTYIELKEGFVYGQSNNY